MGLKLYLAGPMSGRPHWNFPAFEGAARYLRDRGYEVSSPAERDIAEGFDPVTGKGLKTRAEYMAQDLPLVCEADAVVVLPGWEESEGASLEVYVAQSLGKAILEYPTLLRVPTGQGETRITSETGGQKGMKSCQLGAIDPLALKMLGDVAGYGSEKYARNNYMLGYAWSLCFDALMRHALAFWNGEELDPESGLPHMAHAAWHGLALVTFASRGLGTDDRYVQCGGASDATLGKIISRLGLKADDPWVARMSKAKLR